jgi:ABC-2 type transport system ATP-binding protein
MTSVTSQFVELLQSDQSSHVLHLTDVCFRYRASAPLAVDQVSLHLKPGEIFGLLGPNGAGKSTLMALISGLRRPQQGTIRRAPEVAARGGFALVPQEHAFYPMLTCRENLEFFAGVLGLKGAVRRSRVEAAIAATGLEQVTGKRASECSGGLKRRLNLAIGLVGDPRLLLLDEPTVGVDPHSRAFLLEVVQALRTQGKTIVYASHYMEEVQQVGDRVGIIDHGRLLCCGTLDELLTQSQVRLSVRASRLPNAELHARLVTECGLETAVDEPGWLSFAVPPGRMVEDVLRSVRTCGLQVTSFQYGCRHLEDVFLKLTHRHLRD